MTSDPLFLLEHSGIVSLPTTIAVAAGISLPVFLPYLQLGFIYTFWPIDKPEVDRQRCQCGCWDTIFKGSYEHQPAGYHHMYFNVTWNTLCIWAVTVVAVIGCYEATKHVTLLSQQRSLRIPMLLLLLATVYPHYYTWWSFVNMWNDDFYKQWPHQSYFSITEAISTFAILRLCDSQRPLKSRLLLTILVIGAFHILAGSWDQFVSNVLMGKGFWYQQSRDLAFVGFDFLNVIVSGLYLWQMSQQACVSRPGPTRRDLSIAATAVMLLTFVTALL